MDPRDAEERPARGQEVDSGDETDNGTGQKHRSPPAEWYLEACRWTGCAPVSSYLRQLGEANLDLNHYGVGRLGAKALAVSLRRDNAVTNLELEDNALQAEGTRYLTEMLQINESIESLNLSNNQLHLEGAQIISKMLSITCNITTLKLSGDWQSLFPGEHICVCTSAISEFLFLTCTFLHAGNHFDDSAAKYLADALKVDYIVKELDLSHNNIFDAGGEHLGHMLASNAGIRVLDLTWNHLGTRTAAALGAALKVNWTLQQLQLAWNGLGPAGAQSLGEALEQNSTLVLLDLSRNLVDDRAAALLGQGLATNAALGVLRLSRNPLTTIGARSLLRAVTENPNSALKEMDVSTVFVCETFVELLEEARQRRPGLDVRHSVMSSVTRNISALRIFHKFFKERNESIMDFFRSLDEKGTKKVPTSVFRKAVKEANVPLDRRQIEWLIKKFDEKCTCSIVYRSVSVILIIYIIF
uniref:leucine-rich repeat-containing protein 74A-like isoform X1 n=1 Tax=Gasterosteus aculeatus aculeatus TaxID=481459 RepID=UPI001A97DA45|nr:leucine-rich repeat-containing protein 74A-like isoform X1 [Gasterosteus aculeatus aculeatus]XP_040016443.1 leucine-rich repeat-containing protein 74A-like isoform X1 [Gasterosteus aculeatus aculeatus]XP_040016445.1 leucine-rich repeat-containing protein 74A-like isoform X1 [Gasterosteus aculeatus aculeatus]